MYENGRKEKFFNHDMGNSCEPGFIHVIQPGDTLYLLAQKYHVSVSDIMYKNPYANVYHLRPGDELCIPILAEK